MEREIDRLAAPEQQRKMKVIVASASRTGTLSLYRAMGILGFKTYHVYEAAVYGGAPHLRILQEAISGEYNKLSGIKPLEKPELEKWLGEYDCLVEIPSYIGLGALQAYADDPDVKFILTERDPEKWARSFSGAIAPIVKMAGSFPLNILKHFDAHLGAFLQFNVLAYSRFTGGLDPRNPGADSALREHYMTYIEEAKRILPKDRTLFVQLENGIGWETICPFLGVPIPDEDYPPPNDQTFFKAMLDGFIKPKIMAAFLRFGALVVPVVGVTGYVGWKYWASL